MEAVRSLVQPVTHNLPHPVRDAAITLLGDQCYKTLVLDVDPSSTECLKLAVSKSLGIGIILASSIVKVPQIIKLASSQSAAGLSFPSYLLETTAYLISLAYNARHGFPFSTYGETALIAVQNVVIAVLILQYSGRAPLAAVFVAGLAAGGAALFQERVVGEQALAYLQAFSGVLGVASKAPQIWTVWREGGTGQLSAFAVFNYLAGSLSRIFTTLQEVDDKLILYGFVAGFILNAVLATQMVYYWNAPSAKKTPAGKKKGKQEKLAVGGSKGPSTTPKKGKSPSTRRRG